MCVIRYFLSGIQTSLLINHIDIVANNRFVVFADSQKLAPAPCTISGPDHHVIPWYDVSGDSVLGRSYLLKKLNLTLLITHL
jgi:hypothetical protein